MRVAVDEIRREAGLHHHRRRLGLAFGAAELGPENPQRLGDGVADRWRAVEAGQRILEDDLQVLARRLQRLLVGVRHVAAQHRHRAAGGRDQGEHGARQRGFAAAALADHAQRLALADLEAHAVHRAQLALLGEEALADREPDLHVVAADDHRRVVQRRRQRRATAAVGAVEARDRRQQALGVVGLRIGEQRLGLARLDVGAVLHHAHPVGKAGDDAHVVGDQHHRRVRLALQVGHQVEDLGLHGDVEGGSRLVGDQQIGPAGHRRGDHHPLAHAAGELVRILGQPPARVGDTHLLQPQLRAWSIAAWSAHAEVQRAGARRSVRRSSRAGSGP